MVHRLKNHLTVVLGFASLLLEDVPASDPKRAAVIEIQNAATRALADIPELARRLAESKADR